MTDTRPLYSPAPQHIVDLGLAFGPKLTVIIKEAYEAALKAGADAGVPEGEAVNDALSLTTTLAGYALIDAAELLSKTKGAHPSVATAITAQQVCLRVAASMARTPGFTAPPGKPH
jgi:phage-related minor tail protein